ncbi:MAG: hypothetical protein ACOZAN_04415 [Patescibacteria group bacterium]
MKENSKKILLWLYPVDATTRWVRKTDFEWLIPDLSSSGLRSLLFYLQHNEMISYEKVAGDDLISLTSYGKKAISDSFPVFSEERQAWHGDWIMVVFQQPPKMDASFRYLRKILLTTGFLSLARGVFIYPSELPDSIKELLHKLYRNSVAVIRFRQWAFGDERKIIGQKSGLIDQIELYSSISKELQQLLRKKMITGELNYQQKSALLSVFNRFYTLLTQDIGVSHHYFPQVITAGELLSEFKKLL